MKESLALIPNLQRKQTSSFISFSVIWIDPSRVVASYRPVFFRLEVASLNHCLELCAVAIVGESLIWGHLGPWS